VAEAVLLLALAVVAMAAILALRASETGRWRRELVAFRLRFPRGLDADQLVAFLAGLASLAPSRYQRPVAAHALVFEITADARGIRHHLLIPRRFEGTVAAQLRAAVPHVRLEVDEAHSAPAPRVAAELGLTTSRRSLRHQPAEVISAGVLASLYPLAEGQAVTVQWLVAPEGSPAPVPDPARHQAHWWELTENVTAEVRGGEGLRALRAKRAWPLFGVAVRIGATAASDWAAWQLLGRVTAALRTTNAPGVRWRHRWLPVGWVTKHLAARTLPLLHYPAVLNAAELAAVIGVPLGAHALPGLAFGGAKQLPPPAELPTRGRVLALSDYPGAERRPLALSRRGALRHLHVIGPSGVGKSTLLAGSIVQDIDAGYGVVVIDGQGDLTDVVLDRIPERRVGDVVLLNGGDAERPVGFNPLSGAGEAAELVADETLGIFRTLYRAWWGPRTDDILRAALLTLALHPGMSLAEVPLLLLRADFRRRLTAGLDDDLLAGFWAWYESLSPAARAEAIGPVMNKLRSFLGRRLVRHVVGQADSTFSLERALAHGQIVLVNLPRGLMGDDASMLLGSLVVAKLLRLIQRRAALPPERRRPVFAYLDEFQDFLALPVNLGSTLVHARKLGLGLSLAHQHRDQLPSDMWAAVIANCASRVVFRMGADDARVLARELAPDVDAADLQGLPTYGAVLRLATDNGVAPPATGTTLALPPATGLAAVVRDRSRQHYGRDAATVEAALRQRWAAPDGRGPVGRRAA